MASTINRLEPVPRNQGTLVPGLLPASNWIDGVALVANVAKSYASPVDGNANKGTIYRINCSSGPLYGNFQGAATVPGDNTAGNASFLLRTDIGPVLLVLPAAGTALSLFSPNTAAQVTIEVWN